MTTFTPALSSAQAVASLACRVAARDTSDIAAKRILTDAAVIGFASGQSDELAQAAAVRLWENRGTLKGKTTGYARSFAKCRMLNDLRASGRYAAHLEGEAIDAAETADGLDAAERVADPAQDLSHTDPSTTELVNAIETAAASHPNPVRALAVVNCLRKGYRPSEIAARLGVAESAVSKVIAWVRENAAARVQF